MVSCPFPLDPLQLSSNIKLVLYILVVADMFFSHSMTVIKFLPFSWFILAKHHLDIVHFRPTMGSTEEYVCTLDEASLKKAREELNEDSADRMNAVEAFRNLIKTRAPHIRCSMGKVLVIYIIEYNMP